ncbi:MAG: FxLD family lanthipeptide [Pseudonocardiaceae bacterium]
MNAVAQSTTAADSEFDLDVRIVESGEVVAELMQNTDDNCTSTQQSACVTCVGG